MIRINDQELELLLPRIAAGDETALRALILQYSPRLTPYIQDFVHSPEQTEEVLQDVFVQIWQLRESLSTVQNFNVFIYVIAKRHALNALRTTLREYARRKKWQEMQMDDAPADDGRLDLIEAAIQALPPQLRQVWLLSRREGRSHADVAGQLNLATGSIAKYIERANVAITSFVVERADLLLLAALLHSGSSKNIF